MIACKQQHSEQPAETSTPESAAQSVSASVTPAAVPPVDVTREPVAPATISDADRVIKVRAVIAQLPTEYSAAFAANQLRSIAETRDVAGRGAQGRYEFYGARLTRYSGEQLLGPAAVELEFDLQGVLLSKETGLDGRDVEAIKTRSQLLRSHALAQQATRAH
jgi:hypothetical protein